MKKGTGIALALAGVGLWLFSRKAEAVVPSEALPDDTQQSKIPENKPPDELTDEEKALLARAKELGIITLHSMSFEDVAAAITLVENAMELAESELPEEMLPDEELIRSEENALYLPVQTITVSAINWGGETWQWSPSLYAPRPLWMYPGQFGLGMWYKPIGTRTEAEARAMMEAHCAPLGPSAGGICQSPLRELKIQQWQRYEKTWLQPNEIGKFELPGIVKTTQVRITAPKTVVTTLVAISSFIPVQDGMHIIYDDATGEFYIS